MGCPGRWQELGWKEGSWRRPCTGPKNTSTWFSVSEGHLNFKLSPTKELPKIPQKLRSAWRTGAIQKTSLFPECQFYQSPAEIERSILANLRQNVVVSDFSSWKYSNLYRFIYHFDELWWCISFLLFWLTQNDHLSSDRPEQLWQRMELNALLIIIYLTRA